MGEAFRCAFEFVTKNAYAALAAWLISGAVTFLPVEFWPRGVESMHDSIAGWAFITFILSSGIVLYNCLRWCGAAVAAVRKRNQAVRTFNRLPARSREIVLRNWEGNRQTFAGDIRTPEVSALVQLGFVWIAGATYDYDLGAVESLKLSPMMVDLLEHRRDELAW